MGSFVQDMPAIKLVQDHYQSSLRATFSYLTVLSRCWRVITTELLELGIRTERFSKSKAERPH